MLAGVRALRLASYVAHPEVGRTADQFRLVGRVQRWRPERRPATGRETGLSESGPTGPPPAAQSKESTSREFDGAMGISRQ